MPADRAPIVRLLTTGGTIATTVDPGGRSAPTLVGARLAERAAVSGVTVEAIEIGRHPSWSLDPLAMADIAVAARDAARDPGIAGVVVTHGTTTLEYTAFLADLFLDGPCPIVLTGAMRRADDPDPDGPGNLRDAITVAASGAARDFGAVVVFAGRVISARHAWKAHRSQPDAFVDLAGDLGRVADGHVAIDRTVGRLRPFSGRLDPRVALVKAVPGQDGVFVRTAVETGAHGLVIEALPGAGGIPPAMREEVGRAAEDLPIVLASRAPYGRLPDQPHGGTGEPLLDLPLLSAGGLTAEQAWLLLMAVLAETADDAALRRRFHATVAAMT
jgi:L-asparaginase